MPHMPQPSRFPPSLCSFAMADTPELLDGRDHTATFRGLAPARSARRRRSSSSSSPCVIVARPCVTVVAAPRCQESFLAGAALLGAPGLCPVRGREACAAPVGTVPARARLCARLRGSREAVAMGGPRRHRPRLVAGRAPGLRGLDDLRFGGREPYPCGAAGQSRAHDPPRHRPKSSEGAADALQCAASVCIMRGAVTASSWRFEGLRSMQ